MHQISSFDYIFLLLICYLCLQYNGSWTFMRGRRALFALSCPGVPTSKINFSALDKQYEGLKIAKDVDTVVLKYFLICKNWEFEASF